MQWHWKGIDPPADQQKKDASDIAAVAAGTKTRDEYRTERGQQAFGLPLTKNPTVVTPTGGLVNLADPTSATGPQPPGAPVGNGAGAGGDGDDSPGGSAGSGGTQRTNAPDKPKPTPSNDDSKTTPLHDSMADQKPAGARTGKSASAELRAELTKLMNFQRHGKPVTKFQSQHIAPDLMHYIQTSGMPIKDVIAELDREDDPAYKTVSDASAYVMRALWADQIGIDYAFDTMTKSMQVNAPDVPLATVEEIARSLTAGKSPAECLAALKRYFEVLHVGTVAGQ
jgi:hypothetical protein